MFNLLSGGPLQSRSYALKEEIEILLLGKTIKYILWLRSFLTKGKAHPALTEIKADAPVDGGEMPDGTFHKDPHIHKVWPKAKRVGFQTVEDYDNYWNQSYQIPRSFRLAFVRSRFEKQETERQATRAGGQAVKGKRCHVQV